MEFKPKNREWVKNALIVFLSIMLVLTFFSNTIMNYSLAEVATQYVSDGSIVAQVRGSGTVTANGTHNVKATETREIRAVMVKVGQEVNAGDVLFVLGQGDSEELEAAQESLRQLQLSYQKAAISMPTYNYTADERKIKQAEEVLDAAEKAETQAWVALETASNVPKSEIEAAKGRLEKAQKTYDELAAKAQETQAAAEKRVEIALAEVERLLKEQNAAPVTPAPEQSTAPESSPDPSESSDVSPEPTPEATPAATPAVPVESEELKAARKELADAQLALETLTFPELTAAKDNVDRCQAELDSMLNASGSLKAAYDEAVAARKVAEDNVFTLKYDLEQKKLADQKSQQLASLDLSDIGAQIAKQQKKIKELSGGEENEIIANVSGTVQSVSCTAGDTKLKDDILCTIEVPDMGYTLSFSVTNDQAKRLRPGDTATVSNYYWGSQIVATLSTIAVDPKAPQTNKLLTFDLSGDVNTGAELSISVGSKSARYDIIIPNNSIRSDTNGSFVLKIEAKNSPLGNRYIARRVDIEVLASDDTNSAVTGDLQYGDYVITTSNAPIENGDQVRMADS